MFETFLCWPQWMTMRVRIHSQGNYIKFLKQFSTRDYRNACHHSNDFPLDVKYVFWCLQFFLEDNSIWYDGMNASLCLHVGNIIKPALLACMISWAMKNGVVLFCCHLGQVEKHWNGLWTEKFGVSTSPTSVLPKL